MTRTQAFLQYGLYRHIFVMFRQDNCFNMIDKIYQVFPDVECMHILPENIKNRKKKDFSAQQMR